MSAEVVKGNALTEGESRRGWFIGHFINPTDDPRSTDIVEVKWAFHKAGEGRTQWATNAQATTLSMLISGRFCLQFPDQEVVLSNQGDYVLWLPGVPHWWSAESDSTVVTVRWPSTSGDSIDLVHPGKS
ncbi:MAG TPA: hypothetical protein V6D12_00820 [Candidatus Obscuribacterales bacterium]